MTEPTIPLDTSQSVTDFDFRRLDQLPTTDIQDFRNVQEAFAERFAADLSGYLRTDFSIVLQDVRQLSWGAYAARFTSPACLMLLRAQVMAGYGAVELSPAFIFTVLEILLGGITDSAPNTSRELTKIEKKLLALFFRSLEDRLQEAWSEDGPAFVLESVVGAPGSVVGMSHDDPIVLAEFVVKAGGANGHLCLAVPARFVRRRRQNSDSTAPAVPNLRQPGDSEAILSRIRTGTVRAETRLTQASIRIGDLAALRSGDVLNLGHAVSSPLSMCVNGADVYCGFIVPVGGKRAFSIQSVRMKGSD
jgi:flagellar motor switch protein FliM